MMDKYEQGGSMDTLISDENKKKFKEYINENGVRNYASYESILKEVRSDNFGGRGYKPSSSSTEHNTLNLLKKLGVLYEVTDKRKPISKRGYYLKNKKWKFKQKNGIRFSW